MSQLPAIEASAITAWSQGSGAVPPCGKPRYAWVASAHWQDGAVADANLETCVIEFGLDYWHFLRDTRNLGELCLLVVHEIGHLYGQGHTARGVMMAEDQPSWHRVPACRRVMA